MGRTVLITSSFLHFLRQSAAKHNATSEVISRQSAFVQTIGSFCQWLKGQYNPWPCMYTQRSGKAGGGRESCQGEQQELTWIILEDQHTCLRVRPLVTTDAGSFPKSNYKSQGNSQPLCTSSPPPTYNFSVTVGESGNLPPN